MRKYKIVFNKLVSTKRPYIIVTVPGNSVIKCCASSRIAEREIKELELQDA